MNHCNSVLIVGSPFPHYSRQAFLKKLTGVISDVCMEVCVIGANEPASRDNIEWIEFTIDSDLSNFRRQILFFKFQVQSVSGTDDYDFVIIRDAPCIVSASILRLMDAEHATIITQKTNRPFVNFVSKVGMKISKNLIVESPSVLEQWGTQYGSKAEIGATYVDVSQYNIQNPFDQRPNSIGYLGILRDRKGIPQFLECLPKITDKYPELSVKIAGDGPLNNTVLATAAEINSVEYSGFIKNSEVANFYNSLRLLVLPTESEGLPNVALEAMACGTPVLATAVGGLPDLITDGRNGFLMTNNSAKDIRSNVSRALDSDLQAISERARDTVQDKYTFDDAVQRYEQIVTR